VNKNIILREYHSEDCAEIMQLFYDTIHSVNAADYNENQLDAWAPKEIDIAYWDSRFLQDHAVVAEKDGIIVGIGTLKSAGYFDLLYVHKDYQRIGIATLIADEIERCFRVNGITTVTTDASITARPFFENRGYVVLKKQSVETRGQSLINFKMQKMLLS
jgi:putative acetyltransferase